jgi:hypothetical protein
MRYAIFIMLVAFCVSPAIAGEDCPPAGGWNFICGPTTVEDLVAVPGTHWIVGSGMSEARAPGRLHLIDADKKTWEAFYPGASPAIEFDQTSYPACPGAPDTKNFGAHGIAIRDDGNKISTLLAVNHGREAVEVFKINASGAKPSIRWIGCVPMSETVSLNAVAFLPKGGFVATKFYDPKAPGGFSAIMSQKITGGVLEWHPGTGVKSIGGTDLSGANGIEVSEDGGTIYVAEWGTQQLVRFIIGTDEAGIQVAFKKDIVKLDFMPDNLRMTPKGTILAAGQNRTPSSTGGFAAFKGWTIVELDPKTMKVSEIAKDAGELPLQNVSVALDLDGTLWIGAFRGDRVAYKRK